MLGTPRVDNGGTLEWFLLRWQCAATKKYSNFHSPTPLRMPLPFRLFAYVSGRCQGMQIAQAIYFTYICNRLQYIAHCAVVVLSVLSKKRQSSVQKAQTHLLETIDTEAWAPGLGTMLSADSSWLSSRRFLPISKAHAVRVQNRTI